MPTLSQADVERRALALFERLFDRPGNARLRDRLLAREEDAVRARVAALERSHRAAAGSMPTIFPADDDEGPLAAPPERIGPFRLVAAIGSGGMGQVWRAVRDDGLYDQSVAIKFIRAHIAPLAGSRFAEERRILARLEHPNIARLIDGGVTEAGIPYLVMEYIDGLPISDFAEGLSERRRVDLLIKAADAVQFAHARLVVHADLKPSNILVDPAGRVKLLDFGIARLLEQEDVVETILQPMTRDYASPARLAGNAPSIADDVFALGIILRDLIGETRDADLRAIAARAARPNETTRYGSVAALIADLERWRDRLPVSAQPSTVAYRARKFIERHRLGVAATVAAMLILGGAALVATRNYQRAERARAEADARFGELRSLAKYQLFDLYDRLRASPGTVALRADIAARSARYLDQLGAAPNAPVALKLETATGYRRLAAVQGLSGTSSLGQPAAARRSLALSEKLLREVIAADPRNAEALETLGWVYADRWTLLANNAESPRMNQIARGWFDKALAIDPARKGALLGQLVTRKSAAYDLIVGDQPAQATPVLTAALATLRATRFDPADRDAARQLEMTLLNLLGDASYDSGDIAGSLPYYREQQALTEAAIAAHGETPDWLIRNGEAMFDLSGSLGDLPGRSVEALAAADGGIASVRRVLDYGPDANAEKKLVMLLGQRALVLSQLKRHAEAIDAAEQSLAIRRTRLHADPRDPARVRDVAIGANSYAGFLAAGGRRADACTAAREAVANWAVMRARGQLGARDARKNVPESEALVRRYCAGIATAPR